MPQANFEEDYISFSGIKSFTKAFLRSLFGLIGFLKLTLTKNKWWILLGLLVGLALGDLYYISRPTYYKESMIVQYNELTKKTYAEMLSQLNRVISRGKNNSGLAAALSIPQPAAATVIFIDSRNINDEPLSGDTSSKIYQPFKILVNVTDNSQLDVLQPALITYLNNSPYLKRKREEQTKLYKARIEFIDGELRKLDSLKIEYNRFLATSKISATFYNNAFDPADIYDQSTLLANQKENLQRWLTIDQNAVTVIDGFKLIESRSSMSLVLSLLVFGLAGALIFYVFALAAELRKAVTR